MRAVTAQRQVPTLATAAAIAIASLCSVRLGEFAATGSAGSVHWFEFAGAPVSVRSWCRSVVLVLLKELPSARVHTLIIIIHIVLICTL